MILEAFDGISPHSSHSRSGRVREKLTVFCLPARDAPQIGPGGLREGHANKDSKARGASQGGRGASQGGRGASQGGRGAGQGCGGASQGCGGASQGWRRGSC